jgi:hypothetical protein
VGGLEQLAPLAPSGALVTLIAFAVLAVYRGWLVPKATVDQITAANDRVAAVQSERLDDSRSREEEWRAAWTAERARGDLQEKQIDELLELARTTDAALRGLKTAAKGQ